MSEKEKMLAGELYNAFDGLLVKERAHAKDLCYLYNHISPSERKTQAQIIRKLFGRVGERYEIAAPLYVDYGYNIEIGENFFANYNTVILDCAKVTFGNNVLIGPNCGFYTAGHPIDKETRNKGLEYARPITVGNDVWIGGGVQVMPGVNIGNNVVIGGGSVVVKDIPDGVVAVGNPCKVVSVVE